jgi:YD repeat-containing protein
MFVGGLAHAQSTTVSPEDEYRKAIKVSEDIQPLGENPFGEQIGLYNGSLSFQQTDIELKGTGPAIRLDREFQLQGRDWFFTTIPDHAFGDWEISLPRIETETSSTGSLTSWQTSGTSATTAVRNQRCTYFDAPPPVTFVGDAERDDWTPYEWWSGYHLIVPGAGDQEMMPRSSANTLAPTMAGLTFPIVTKEHWQVGCLAATSSGEPGEAFFAVAPDGTKYTFDYLVYRSETTVRKPLNSGTGPQALKVGGGIRPNASLDNFITRRKGWMLVSRIEDRFGNAVTYHYDGGKLRSIDATDGRSVGVSYTLDAQGVETPRISMVVEQPLTSPQRAWRYSYSSTDPYRPTLSSVQLPDGKSSWNFSLAGLQGAYQDFDAVPAGNCNVPARPGNAGTPYSGYIDHPSGLRGTFTVAPVAHGRSGVFHACWGVHQAPQIDGYAVTPSLWYSLTLVSKTESGAGVPSRTWNYQYSAPNNSWYQDCPTTASCASTVTTDVVDPDQRATRYTFSNRYDYTESLLQKTEYFNGSSAASVMRTESNTYVDPTQGTWPWPTYAGVNLQGDRVNGDQLTRHFPLSRKDVFQDGDDYVWQAEAFDAYTNVTRTKRSNSISGQHTLEEDHGYLNDTNYWVLDLPTTLTKLGNGAVPDEIESELTYSGADTPSVRKRFTQTLMSYTFGTDGNLHTFTDGNSHTTELLNYSRGIPTTINYPDGTHETIGVDSYGQISSVQDQAGHTTGYEYWSDGRLKQIDFPAGGQAWNARQFIYDFVPTAERGIAANHWRRTVVQGSAVTLSYYDATWRPLLTEAYDSAVAHTHVNTAFTYDWKGQKTFQSYPADGSPDWTALTPGGASPTGTATTYDAIGRLQQTSSNWEGTGLLTTGTEYLAGAGRRVTDPRGKVTVTHGQVFDTPTYDTVLESDFPTGITQLVVRDDYGNPKSIRQFGVGVDVTKTIIYDPFYRVCMTSEPESGITATGYDGANNVAWTAEGLGAQPACITSAPANAIGRTYDPMNRLLTLVPTDGITQSTQLGYDPSGNLTSAISGSTTWSASRDNLEHLSNESLAVVGQPMRTLVYGYDNNGNVSSTLYPDGATSVTYAPDGLGRPTQAGTYAANVVYHPSGDVASFTLGNGAMYLAGHNTRQLISDFSYSRGAAIDVGELFTYDQDANITHIGDLAPSPTRDKDFIYDDLNRLVSASSNLWGVETYGYDALNNITSRTTGGQTYTYNYPGLNLLASIMQGATTVNTFSYDSRGNTTSRNGTTLNFDGKNQLLGMVGGPTYAYDANGRRVAKHVTGNDTYYFYTSQGQLLYQYDAKTAVGTNYIYLGKRLIARETTLQLAPPGGITFDANPNNGSFVVSWTAVTAATSYTLQESNDGTTWATVYSGSALSSALSGRAGGTYQYRVEGCAGPDCSAFTTSASLGVRPALPVITVPTGTVNGTYTVSWTQPISAASFDVQERVNGGAWSTIAADTATLSITRPGTTSGSYSYQVSAKSAYGTRGYASSTPVTVDTTYGVVPAAPTVLSVPAYSYNGAGTVSWSSSNMATRYVLQQSANSGGSWATAYDGAGISAPVNSLSSGTYIYRVQACSAYGCSAFTAGNEPLVVTLPPTGVPSLSAPSFVNTGAFTVTWSAVPTATSYLLQEQVNGGAFNTVQQDGTLSRSTSGRGNGTIGYRVQACNVAGCGAFSGTATVTSQNPPASAPSLSVPGSSNNGSYTVSWTAVATATSYLVQGQTNGGGFTTLQQNGATSLAVSGKGNGTYGYRVQACNAGGCTGFSNTGAVVVSLVPPVPTSVQTIRTTASPNITRFLGAWGAVAGATRYEIIRDNVQIYSGTGTSFTLQSGSVTFLQGTNRVRSCNASGCSVWVDFPQA